MDPPVAAFHAGWTDLFTMIGTGIAIMVAWGFLLLAGRRLRRWLAEHDPELAGRVGARIRWALLAGLVVAAGWLALGHVPGVTPSQEATAALVARLGLIVLAAYVVGEALVALLALYAQRHGARAAQTAFSRYLLYAAIYGLALVLVMAELGLAITPLVTALGVGGIAVALALQETLSNLFAGLYLVVDRSVQIGDWIELEGGQEGYVEEMTWLAVRIHTVADNTYLIPNHTVATSTLKNAGLPDREIGLEVPVSVALGSDLDQVEAITLEAAGWVQREVGQGPEGYEPDVRFEGIGPVGVRFVAELRADESFEHHALRHAFIKELHQRFEKAGIELAVHPDMAPP